MDRRVCPEKMAPRLNFLNTMYFQHFSIFAKAFLYRIYSLPLLSKRKWPLERKWPLWIYGLPLLTKRKWPLLPLSFFWYSWENGPQESKENDSLKENGPFEYVAYLCLQRENGPSCSCLCLIFMGKWPLLNNIRCNSKENGPSSSCLCLIFMRKWPLWTILDKKMAPLAHCLCLIFLRKRPPRV